MNEGNLHANGHPGIQVIPLAWAVAEQDARSGRDLLAAFVVGYEVSARIKRASATRLAVHPHGTFGTSAPRWRWPDCSATTPPRCARSSTSLPRWAWRPAGAHSPPAPPCATSTPASAARWVAGPHARAERLHGRARRRRVRLRCDLRRPLRPDRAVAGLGEEFLPPRGFIKVHACGRYIHGALDCVETMMARRPQTLLSEPLQRYKKTLLPMKTRENRGSSEALHTLYRVTVQKEAFSLVCNAVTFRTTRCGHESAARESAWRENAR